MIVREMLNANLRALLGGESSVALAFSGGTDSTCLLFSLLELGYRPPLYTYVVQGEDSEDLQRVRWANAQSGLPLNVCVIPNDIDILISDVRRMIADGISGKVGIQCMHGHYCVAPVVKEWVIVNGSGVDGLYGAYRTFAFDGSRKDKAVFDAARQKHLGNPNDDAMMDQERCYARQGVRVVYPYRQQNIIDCLMSLSWEEINKPKMKWVAVKDYWQEFQTLPAEYFRPRGSQQIVAGTRALHDKLLRTPLNQRGLKRVSGIYRDIAAGLV